MHFWTSLARLLIVFVLCTVWLSAAMAQAIAPADLPQKELEVQQDYAAGRFIHGIELGQRVTEAVKALEGDDSARYGAAINWLALNMAGDGRFSDAEPLFERALAIAERVAGPSSLDAGERANNLAWVQLELGRLDRAETLLRRSLSIEEALSGPDHPNTGRALNNLASVQEQRGYFREADTLFRRALDISEKAFGPDNHIIGTRLTNIASVNRALGRFDEAEALLKRALAVLEKALGPENPRVASTLGLLAKLYRDVGRYGDALQLHDRALAIRLKVFGEDNVRTAWSLNDKAALLIDLGRVDEAEPLIRRSLAIRERVLGPDHYDVATSVYVLGGVLEKKPELRAAEAAYNRAIAIQERMLGASHPDLAKSLMALGGLQKSQGRLAEAEPRLLQALQIRERSLGPSHPLVAASLLQLSDLYRLQGRREDSERTYQRALSIKKSGINEVRVRYATDRLRDERSRTVAFGSDRSRSGLTFGSAFVTIIKRPVAIAEVEGEPPAKGGDEANTELDRITIRQIAIDGEATALSGAKDSILSATAFPGQAMIFVHGYNVTFENALRRSAQIAFDTGFDGPVFLFSWPSRQRLLGYFSDRDTVDLASGHLAGLVESILASLQPRRVHFLAHSMGNLVLLQALDTVSRTARQDQKFIGSIVSAAPDVDPDVFDQLTKRVRGAGALVTVYASQVDRALWLSGKLRDRPRLGYISDRDPTLIPGVDVIDITRAGWALFAINHDVYASSPTLVSDIRRIFAGDRPPDKRTPEFEIQERDAGFFWRMR